MGGSIVYTNDNCIGCNKCINVCSAIGACISTEENGKARIEVDGTKCVACGSCIDVCVHGAREFEDDTERFFEDLKKGEKISLLIAPAFRANFPEEYAGILGGLRKQGIRRIISVSFGADITTWGYLNYIEKHNFLGGISQPCPAVVSYIERYLPELLPKLFPVQSPLMCAAIYARKEMGVTDKLAFVSPCIAKKMEMEDPQNAGLVQYNVTFEHLMKYVRDHNIKGEGIHTDIEYGLGLFYPTPGGLAENVRWFLGDQVYIRQIEGERRLYEWMHQNADRIKDTKTPFLFIDALNCEKGCICGTAVNPEKSRTDDALYSLLDIREMAKKDESGDAWSRYDTPAERLKNFNEQFKHLNLEDYLRSYTDRSAECRYEIPDEEALEKIFVSMNKITPESRQINCTCCGYESCSQMATAIHNGFNHRENCIYYEKTMVRELEVEKAIAEETTRAKSAFLANMSHEIRTPINAILGMNELILRESEDPGITEYSESIRSAGNTLLSLVNNILDFSKLETGDMEIRPDFYDLSDLLNDMISMVRTRADDKGLKIITEFDPATPKYLFGDEKRIKQVISNLLTNAVKFTEKGSITIRVGYEMCEKAADCILLKVSVSDTGIGIQKDDLKKLFTEFERIEEKRNRNIAGVGLGMNITQSLLQLMGSELRAESVYGSGSTFSFSLEQGVSKWTELGDYETAYHESMGRRKAYRERFVAPDVEVLVVDDNPMNLVVFKSLLKQTCVKIDTADNGFEALDLSAAKKYDIIFMDHMMPDKDGIETMHDIRGNPADPNVKTPMVCLTANAIAGAREEYIASGFDDYMSKPVDGTKLEEMFLSFLPPEKVSYVTEDMIKEETAGEEAGEALEALQIYDEIDLDTGINNSGSVEAYMPLLNIFYKSIDDKAEEIERFYNENDIKNYTIKVHALKSSARLIGAVLLSKEAERLEFAGKNEDVDFVREKTPEFLEEFRYFKTILHDVFTEENTGDKAEAAPEVIKEILEEIRTAAENMDIDGLDTAFEKLSDYEIPEGDKELFKALESSYTVFDYDGILTKLKG
ncbi:MAG: response regulator [Lachnospiraceae bacterium]|nr:response regulator [Lachnospiraceae bacterium]